LIANGSSRGIFQIVQFLSFKTIVLVHEHHKLIKQTCKFRLLRGCFDLNVNFKRSGSYVKHILAENISLASSFGQQSDKIFILPNFNQ